MSQKKTSQKEDKSEEDGSEEEKENVKDGEIMDEDKAAVAQKFKDGDWANTGRREARLKEWKSYQDEVLCGISIPYADDWNLKGVKVQLFSLGYHHMEKASCATATTPQLIVDQHVKKKLKGDYGKLNFNYVPHQQLITQSVQKNYQRQLDGTKCIFIDCKKIGRDLEKTRDADMIKTNSRHSGWHINNLTVNSRQKRFNEVFKEVNEKVQEIRGTDHGEDKVISIVLFCSKGRHRTESVRCGLHGAFTLAGAEIVDSKALCEPAWANLGCKRCTECQNPDVSYVRGLWIDCFNMLRPEGVDAAVSLSEDDKDQKVPNERSQEETQDEREKREQLEKAQALKAREEAKKGKKKQGEKEENNEAKKRKSCKAELGEKLPELRKESDEVEVEVEVSERENQEESRGSRESRTIQVPLPLDVAYAVLERLLAFYRPHASYLRVAHGENPDPETAIWQLQKDKKIDLAIVSGMITAGMAEHLGITQKQNLTRRSASSKVALLPNRPSESSSMGRSGSRREQDREGHSRSRPREEEERRRSRSPLPRRKGDTESQQLLVKPKARPSESEGSYKPRPLGLPSRWKRVDRLKTTVEVDGRKQDAYWEPIGKENIDIDLTSVGYHEWFDRILEDNAKARDRKPFITWGMPSSDKAEQADAIRINGKFGPDANHDFIKVPPDLTKFRKTVIVRYKDQPGWYVVRDRVPMEDKEELQNPDDVDVALIFALPPRFYRLESNGVVTDVAF